MMYQFSQTKIDDAEYGDVSTSSAQTDKNGSTFGDSTAITEYIGDDGNKTTEMPSISMPDGQAQSTATVVDIKLSKDKPDNLSLDYKPTISTDTTNFQTTVAGYDFTLKNGDDPFNDCIATKGSSTNTYTLTVNGTTI